MEGHRTRCRSSFGNQRSKPLTMWVLPDDARPSRNDTAEPDFRRRQTGKLVLDGAIFCPWKASPMRLNKGREAVLDFDLWRAGAQGFGVEVGENQPRLGTKGQANRPPTTVCWSSTSPERIRREAGPVFLSHVSQQARIPVGQAGLAEHRMLEEDRVRVVGLDLDRRPDQPLLNAARGRQGRELTEKALLIIVRHARMVAGL